MAESKGKDHEIGDSNHLVDQTKEPACFDLLGKTKHDVLMEEPQKENKEDLRRLHSQSSSPDDEELESERKKNKKDDDHENDIQVVDVVVDVHEKKGFLDNIKAHLHGQHKTEEGNLISEEKRHIDGSPKKETKEKKGILEKIKEKLHKNGEGELEEKKDN
uniref:dehydrin ERD14-like n=1 Tax=Erigeron canadensis TaxID=72917 RepID=UPI001CB9A474|nr:dehydrin ERD14-like [Erigeron canadensis]